MKRFTYTLLNLYRNVNRIEKALPQGATCALSMTDQNAPPNSENANQTGNFDMNALLNSTTEAQTPEEASHSQGLGTARLAGSAPVQVTLLLLYCLPLLMLIVSAFASSGFKYESQLLAVTMRIVTQYVDTLRDAFATFVIPFLTAISASRWNESDSGGMKPKQTFFTLIGLLVAAIVLLAFTNVRSEDIQASLDLPQLEAANQVHQTIGIVSAYVKELLMYISLILGVSLWKR